MRDMVSCIRAVEKFIVDISLGIDKWTDRRPRTSETIKDDKIVKNV